MRSLNPLAPVQINEAADQATAGGSTSATDSAGRSAAERELEVRLGQLTDTLIAEQARCEALTTQRAALTMRLEGLAAAATVTDEVRTE